MGSRWMLLALIVVPGAARRLTALAIVALLVTPTFADEYQELLPRLRAEARVFTDGRGHYLATLIEDKGDPENPRPLLILYGDATSFTRLPLTFVSRDVKDAKTLTFDYYDPRARSQGEDNRVVVSVQGAKVTCDRRAATFTLMPDVDARKLLAKATLSAEQRWNRRPYVLARDDGTTYFYVDRPERPVKSTEFHVYTGKRGRLKPLKVTDLVSDTAGSVFVTPQGTLRFTLGEVDRRQTIASGTWAPARKAARTQLVLVPLNAELVFDDLAIYLDQRMGTPCDDL